MSGGTFFTRSSHDHYRHTPVLPQHSAPGVCFILQFARRASHPPQTRSRCRAAGGGGGMIMSPRLSLRLIYVALCASCHEATCSLRTRQSPSFILTSVSLTLLPLFIPLSGLHILTLINTLLVESYERTFSMTSHKPLHMRGFSAAIAEGFMTSLLTLIQRRAHAIVMRRCHHPRHVSVARVKQW